MKMMKKLQLIALLALSTTACSKVNVDTGHEAVLTTKPLLFGHGGVVAEPVKPGAEIVALTTDYIDVNMTPQTFDEVFDDIMPMDNNPVDYHAAVRLQVVDSVQLISKFGPEWYKNNVQRTFQTMNRNQVRQYTMPELALQQVVVAKVESALELELTAFLKANNIPVLVKNITLGKISPNKAIISAYNDTGVQQQRSKTEHQRKLAEDARKEAEQSRAIADRAYQDGLGMTSDQYIRLQQIKMCGEKANCTVVLGASPTPVISVK